MEDAVRCMIGDARKEVLEEGAWKEVPGRRCREGVAECVVPGGRCMQGGRFQDRGAGWKVSGGAG